MENYVSKLFSYKTHHMQLWYDNFFAWAVKETVSPQIQVHNNIELIYEVIMTYEINMEISSIKNHWNYSATSDIVSICVQYVALLTKECGCVETNYGSKIVWILVVLTTVALNWGMSFGS
jgi:hypothetical protein